jgi:hypothetical protein
MVRGDTVQEACTQVPLTLTVPKLTGPQALFVEKLTVPLCAPGVVQAKRTVTV